MRGALRVHEADNVATAIADIAPGEALFADRAIRAAVTVGRGHKVALAPLARGAAVIQYGCPIRTQTPDIHPREPVTRHHLAPALSSAGPHRYTPSAGRSPPNADAPRGGKRS